MSAQPAGPMPYVFVVKNPSHQGGVTYAQAMEVGERFHADNYAAPTIAVQMGIPYETVCAVLDGTLWPECRRLWMDRVFP